MPIKTDGSGKKVPAGCVAIAGAQMLYFLHYKFGIPETAPSWAYSDGDINSYTLKLGNYSVDVWDQMKKTYDIKTAPLIANVCSLLNMNFGNNNSYTDFRKLETNLFDAYGINCTFSTFNSDTLSKSLLSDMPVIVTAQDKSQTRNGVAIIGAHFINAHTFIADRYKRERNVTEYIYEWVYEPEPIEPEIPLTRANIPYVPIKKVYRYYSPKITMIGFNWGWANDDNYDDFQWFALAGDWIRYRYEGDWSANIEMLYDFKIKQ